VKALTYLAPGSVLFGEVPDPEPPAADAALVRMTVAGLCGSDLHLYHGHTPIEAGAVLGHELVGVVEALGPEVTSVRVGDRVVSSFTIACGRCPMCLDGWWSQCRERMILGHGEYFGGLGGAQAELCLIPHADTNLALIPDGVSDEQAVFVGDALATGYFAAVRGQIEAGDTVLVVGAGAVGVMATMSAQLLGAGRVVVVDPVPSRLALVRGLGAEVIDPKAVNVEMEIGRRTDDVGADVVLECVGQMAAVETALRSVRGGGTVSSVGVPSAISADFPFYDAWNRDLTFRSGICNAQAHMGELLVLIEQGRLRPELVVTDTMRLQEAAQAYAIFDRQKAHKLLFIP